MMIVRSAPDIGRARPEGATQVYRRIALAEAGADLLRLKGLSGDLSPGAVGGLIRT
jgi:hypothetical protein